MKIKIQDCRRRFSTTFNFKPNTKRQTSSNFKLQTKQFHSVGTKNRNFLEMKKGKSKKDNREKKKELQKLWDGFLSQCGEYENRINSIMLETATKIRKTYADRLKKLPENVRNMTLTEYMEMQRQEQSEDLLDDNVSSIRSKYEKSKLESERKMTLKKNRLERKRSLSTSVLSGTSTCKKGFPTMLSKKSRMFSESCLNTPLSKVSVAPSYVVTPKFNPKAPISKACMRRPRAGEVVMSLSGSPLHNIADEIPDKPGVAISLGGGKMIQVITEDTEIAKLESEFKKKLDEGTLSTLASVKEKLDRILQK